MSPRPPRRGARWTGSVLAAVVLVAGIAISYAGASAWRTSVAARNRAAFTTTANDIAQTAHEALQRDLDFDSVARAIVAENPALSNRTINRWYHAVNPGDQYPGAVGLVYVEKVPKGGLGRYEAVSAADPLGGEASVPFEILPPHATGPYCFVRLESIQLSWEPADHQDLEFPPGLDVCALPGVRSALTASADERPVSVSGAFLGEAILPYTQQFPRLRQELEANEAAVYSLFANMSLSVTPVYRGGIVPATAAARQRLLLGWMLGAFDLNVVTQQAVAAHPGWSAALELPRTPSSKPVTVVSSGAAHARGFSATLSVATGVPWELAVTGTPVGVASPGTQFRVVFSAGAAFAGLIAALVLVLGTSRRRALELVEQRTGELRYQASHDALTDLPNRSMVLERAAQLLARSEAERSSTTALFIDVDNFKNINDSLGHQAGDELLQGLAERLRTALRPGDTVGRLGGDEFVVLAGDHGGDDPVAIAERVLAALAEPFRLGGLDGYGITASIGVATAGSGTASELLREADIALYRAKASGKNRYALFDAAMLELVETRVELDGALDAEEFFLVYQPVIAVADSATTGVEALLRWRHPTRGDLAPEDFLPILEETGLVVDVGRWVLGEACRQVAEWHRLGHRLTVAVNVSPVQLEDPGFLDDVAAALTGNGLAGDALTVEITEGALIRDPDQAVAVLTGLRRLGVRIAIDDFGTGYSSMSYIGRLPVDILKIDRSFMAGLPTPETSAVVATFVQLSEALGLDTVVEGIEHQSQLDSLRLQHCSWGQGFLFSPPLSADGLLAFLDTASTVPDRNGRDRTAPV